MKPGKKREALSHALWAKRITVDICVVQEEFPKLFNEKFWKLKLKILMVRTVYQSDSNYCHRSSGAVLLSYNSV